VRVVRGGRVQQVVACCGPERIETGWWRGADVQRDYFRVDTSEGSRLWVFRRMGQDDWFLHGEFD
jgi:protein ImuB